MMERACQKRESFIELQLLEKMGTQKITQDSQKIVSKKDTMGTGPWKTSEIIKTTRNNIIYTHIWKLKDTHAIFEYFSFKLQNNVNFLKDIPE